jgi:hypothetical protein
MSIDTKKIAFLEEIEANNKSHSGATLMDHLIGVHDILMGWDAPQYLQDAGLFHSVYGTVVFQYESTQDRDAVRELIGEQAEELVWEFSLLEMPRLENISLMTESQLKEDLLILTKANSLEQSQRKPLAPMMSWREAYDL